jgi:hypothetical protein
MPALHCYVRLLRNRSIRILKCTNSGLFRIQVLFYAVYLLQFLLPANLLNQNMVNPLFELSRQIFIDFSVSTLK